jgi:polyisoprenoid-binding protein YceI
MMHPGIAALVALGVALANSVPAGTSLWSADTARSNVTLTVSNFLVARVSGTLPVAAATIVTAADSTIPAQVDVRLDAGQLTTHDANRDAELRSERFFNVARFPVIRFVSDRVAGTDVESFTIHGQLSMRGATHPIVFTTRCVELGRDPDGKRRLRYEAAGGFRRSDYGMTADRGIVGNQVALHVTIEAISSPR